MSERPSSEPSRNSPLARLRASCPGLDLETADPRASYRPKRGAAGAESLTGLASLAPGGAGSSSGLSSLAPSEAAGSLSGLASLAPGEAGSLSGLSSLAPGQAGGASTQGPNAPDTARPYDIGAELGRGGMGVVYRAEQQSLGRPVAIKTLKPDAESPELHARFVEEARVTGFLDHPNIVPVHDLGLGADGQVQLAMKLVGGRSWQALLDERDAPGASAGPTGGLDVQLQILQSVCNAVAFAHARGIAHLDLKPENVMVGEFGEVLVMDWGLAADIREAEARAADPPRAPLAEGIATPCGTPCYMAPELADGEGPRVGPWTDVYLLGAMLYELLEGRPPHRGQGLPAVLLAASDSAPPEFLAAGPAELLALCRWALAAEPAARPSSVKAFQEGLQDYLSHRESLVISERADAQLEGCSALVSKLGGSGLDGAARDQLYADFAEAVAGFCQALLLWPGNLEAARGEAAARARYASAALELGDLGLATAQLARLEAESHERATLAARAAELEATRAHTERAARRLRVTIVAAAVLVLSSVSVALYFVTEEKDRAVAAERSEKVQRRVAEAQSAEAERQRAAAEEARGQAEGARQNEERARGRAERERAVAVERLSASYRARGFEAFFAGLDGPALLFFEAARSLTPERSEARLAFADAWARRRALRARFEGREVRVDNLDFGSDGASVLIESGDGELRSASLSSQLSERLTRPCGLGQIEGSQLSSAAPGGFGCRSRLDPQDPNRLVWRLVRVDDAGRELAGLDYLDDLVRFGGVSSTNAMIASADGGAVIVRESQELLLWRPGSGGAPLRFEDAGGVESYHLPCVGPGFLVTAARRLELRAYTDGRRLARREASAEPLCVALVTSGTVTRVALGLRDGGLETYALSEGLPRCWKVVGDGRGAGVAALTYDARSGRLASVDQFGEVSVRAVVDGALLGRARSAGVPGVVALSVGGARLAVGAGPAVTLWELREDGSLRELGRWAWPRGDASALAFDATGERLAVGTATGAVRVLACEALPASPLRHVAVPSSERGFAHIARAEGGRYLLFGTDVYTFTKDAPRLVKFAENGAQGLVVARTAGVIARSSFGGVELSLIREGKVRGRGVTALSGQPMIAAVPPGGPVTIIAASKGGGVTLFGRDGARLPRSEIGDGRAGDPSSILVAEHGRAAAVSFVDGRVSRFSLGSEGVLELRSERPEGCVGVVELLDWRGQALLMRSRAGVHLLDTRSGACRRVPRAGVAAARLLPVPGDAGFALVTVDARGRVERWSEALVVEAQASTPSVLVKDLLRAQGARAGRSVAWRAAADAGPSLLATSLDDHVYLWAWPELTLLWRSPVIDAARTPGSRSAYFEAPRALDFASDGRSLILLDASDSFGIQGLSVLSLPGLAPASPRVAGHLERVEGLKLSAGRPVGRR